MIVENALELVGRTPLVEIRKLNPNSRVKIYAKLEKFNPSGSVKDRIAKYMIEQAEKEGELTREKIIIEPTSGNTGIALAMIAAIKGYKIILVMPESVSEERRRILKAYGAEIILTPKEKGTDGAIEKAYEMVRKNPDKYFMPDQFNNPFNAKAHYETTAKEILEDVPELTHFIAGLGTTGTFVGIAKRLKEVNPQIRTIAVEPFPNHAIQGLKNLKEAYKPTIWDKRLADEIRNVEDAQAFEMCRELVRKEGLFVGLSSGAAMWIAREVAKEIDEGIIVTIFPDGGEKYLSLQVWG
jgi:cysteine synthase